MRKFPHTIKLCCIQWLDSSQQIREREGSLSSNHFTSASTSTSAFFILLKTDLGFFQKRIVTLYNAPVAFCDAFSISNAITTHIIGPRYDDLVRDFMSQIDNLALEPHQQHIERED